jgi:hypothetical protein
MPKLLPSQLSDEEILSLLESGDAEPETQEVFDYEHDIVPFLSHYQIVPGEAPVKKKLLYKLYKTYSKEPLDQLNFNIQVGNYLDNTGRYYQINLNTFSVSNHIYRAEQTRDKTKSLTYQKHFKWFLQEANVKSGNVWIEGFILFFIYKDFCRSRRVNPKLGYVNFHKFLKLHLSFRRVNENRSLWFKVNKETATIFNEDECERIRQARQKTGRSQEKASGQTETSSAS